MEINKGEQMKISTYNSLLTDKRTILVLSKGKCGHPDYVEYQVQYKFGRWFCYRTDGYEMDQVGIYFGEKGLKSVINLIWGK